MRGLDTIALRWGSLHGVSERRHGLEMAEVESAGPFGSF